MINIWCDGSCNNKTGEKGGVGVVIRENTSRDIKVYFEGSFQKTTSARMEIYGLLMSLKLIKNKKSRIKIHCDNQYVVNSINEKWVFLWEVEEWRNRKNSDLWKLVLKEYRKYPLGNVTLQWIRGHNDNPYNEIADRLANIGAHSKDIIEDF